MYAKSAAARLLLSLDWLIKSQLLIPCGSSLCYTNCMNHLITHLHLNSSFAAVQVRAGFLALPGWLQHLQDNKKSCFIFFVYSLAVRIIQIIRSNLSLFYYSSCSCSLWNVYYTQFLACVFPIRCKMSIIFWWPGWHSCVWLIFIGLLSWVKLMTFPAASWAINEWIDGTWRVWKMREGLSGWL